MRIYLRRVSAWRVVMVCLLVAGVVGALATGICLRRPPVVWTFSGTAMADRYQVIVVDPPAGLSQAACERAVAEAIARIDRLFSTYRDDSEVVRFSRCASVEWQSVSAETARGVAAALGVARECGGVYDITIAPLVDLWGFGPAARPATRPSQSEIRTAMECVGLDKIEVRLEPPALRKLHPGTRIDLSSIGQGFAVDAAARQLQRLGVTRYFIDFSGEILVRGPSARGGSWQVAIEAPTPGQRQVQQVVAIGEGAMATSGDYRNYIDVDGLRYSHILDARTGYPISHMLASVTVWHNTCTQADAWATALLAAGPEQGRAAAQRMGLRAMFIVRQEDGFRVFWTGRR